MWEWFRTVVLGQTDDKLFATSRVVRVLSSDHWRELHTTADTSNETIVVAFTAAWCGPCRYMAPCFHELSNRYPRMVFLKVDVDALREIGKSNGVTMLPTFVFYRHGHAVDRHADLDKRAFEARVCQHHADQEAEELKAAPSTGLVRQDIDDRGHVGHQSRLYGAAGDGVEPPTHLSDQDASDALVNSHVPSRPAVKTTCSRYGGCEVAPGSVA